MRVPSLSQQWKSVWQCGELVPSEIEYSQISSNRDSVATFQCRATPSLHHEVPVHVAAVAGVVVGVVVGVVLTLELNSETQINFGWH